VSAKSYLIKVGEGSDEKVKDASNFAKVLTVKAEADSASITSQVREDLFGKNAPPVTAAPREDDECKAWGEFSGELTLDAIKQAFTSFGPVSKVALARKGVCKVLFETKAAAAAAVAKAELSVGGVAVRITERQPRSPVKKAAPQQQQSKGDAGRASTKVYMKIDELPEGVDSKTIKELYAKFGVEMADVNTQAKHCILRFGKAESVPQVLKEKIVTASGKELVAKPYFPRGSKPSTNGNAQKEPAKERAPRPPTFKVLIDEADPAKCTREQLEDLFKGSFKGFVALNRTRSDPSKYTVSYDNEAAVQEILKAKEITCGTAKLKVRAPEPRPEKPQQKESTGANRRGPRAPRAIIVSPPADVTEDQVRPAVQALDAGATVEKGSKSGDFLISFPSEAARDAAIGKQIKVGSHTLKLEASRPPEQAEFGAFLPGADKALEKEITDAVKAIVEVVSIKFLRNGALVGLKSAKDEEKLLASTVKAKDAAYKPEMLKRKVAAN